MKSIYSIREFIYKQIIPILIIGYLMFVFILVFFWNHISQETIKIVALQGVTARSRLLEEFRTIYTSEVVNKVIPYGIEVTHDYKLKEKAIPLPATFTIELGKRVATQYKNAEVKLYSDYPFPWRKKEGGPQDKFESEALRYLRKYPGKTFFRFENYKGQYSLRFAKADKMRESCVACHNTHPQSPKKDWKVNDVRGVLEILFPIEPVLQKTRSLLYKTLFLFVAIGLVGLIIIILLINRFRDERDILEKIVKQRTQDLEKTNQGLKETQSQLLQMGKLTAMGELAAGMAHELTQPLAGISGFTSAMISDIDSVAANESNKLLKDFKTDLEIILKETKRMTILIDDIREFAQISTTTKEKIDINQSILAALNLFTEQLKMHNIILVTKLSSDLPLMLGNLNQLQQVFINLFTNARDAMSEVSEKRILTVSSNKSKDQKFIEVIVEDSGVGIKNTDMEKIFEPFFTTKRAQKGTGLGMSIIMKIIKGHNGEIALSSKPDQGTKIVLSFPIK